MARTQNSAKSLSPRVLDDDEENEKLTTNIVSFGRSEVSPDFSDTEEQAQK